MEIDDMPKEEFAAIRRQAMGKMNSSESSHFNLPQKNISSLTLMKLVFMSIICVLLSFVCAICASIPTLLTSFTASIVLFCFSAIFGTLGFAYSVSAGVYIGVNSK